MQRRATSKKRAAEAEKEVDMGDKEATPVEDPEMLLAQMESKQPEQSGEQPEVPTPKGEVNLQEALRQMIMDMGKKLSEEIKSTKEDNKKMGENLGKKMDDDNHSLNEKLEDLKEDNRSTKEELGRKIENLSLIHI